ncbi:MAG: SDR family oxidoreductase [Deltaproteobacteria bacterium]|nr:SDR family oxidoreductase [Deltaproteobacteria bacterium]
MSKPNRYRSVLRDDLFRGQTHLVTGGGSGIGRCTAHELASLGAAVVLTGRTQSKLETVKLEIEQSGGKVFCEAFDIRDEDKVKRVVGEIVDKHGAIDALVNNAGGQFPSPLSAISKNGFDAVVSTNLTGGFLMAREVFNQSMQKYGGSVVNIVADMWNGMPGMGHSGAARAGMVNLTKTAAVEWAASGVRVNAVAPGWIASSGLDTYEGAAREMLAGLKKHVPLRRLGEEAEVSALIAFLLSDAAAFITGVTVEVDGGAPLGNALYPTADHDSSKPYLGFHLGAHPKVLSGSSET